MPSTREVLRLIDHQYHAAAVGIFLDDEILQALEQGYVALGVVGIHGQCVQHPLQKLAAIALCVRDQPDRDMLLHIGQELLHESGLARPDLAGDQR